MLRAGSDGRRRAARRRQHGQRHKHRQQEPPQVEFGIPDADRARAAQRRPVQRPKLVGQREVQTEPALLTAGRMQPAGDAAEADVGLGDPLGAARHQAGHDHGRPRPAPPDHDGRHDQRRRQVHGVPAGPGSRTPRSRPARPASPAPCRGPQEAAHGGQAAERGPHVRHGLGAVILRHPQAAEQQPASPSTQAGRSRRQVHSATVRPRPQASDRYTRSAATEPVSAATGATSSGMPRAAPGRTRRPARARSPGSRRQPRPSSAPSAARRTAVPRR